MVSDRGLVTDGAATAIRCRLEDTNSLAVSVSDIGSLGTVWLLGHVCDDLEAMLAARASLEAFDRRTQPSAESGGAHAVIESLLTGRGTAGHQAFALGASYVALVIGASEDEVALTGQVRAALIARAADWQAAVHWTAGAERGLVLLPFARRDRLDRYIAMLSADSGVTVAAGSSGQLGSVDRFDSSRQEAELAFMAARRGGRGGHLRIDDPAVLTMGVLGAALDAVVALAVQRLPALTALVEHDRASSTPLADTVRTWLGCGGNTAEAAALLDIHANSFRYRLRQAEKLTGVDFGDVRMRMALHLALEALHVPG